MQSIISMQIKLISLGAIIQDIRNAALKQNEHKEKWNGYTFDFNVENYFEMNHLDMQIFYYIIYRLYPWRSMIMKYI